MQVDEDWVRVLDSIVSVLTTTSMNGRPLFICAAMDSLWNRFCIEIGRQSALLVSSQESLHGLILNFASPLRSDSNGVAVLKAFQSLE